MSGGDVVFEGRRFHVERVVPEHADAGRYYDIVRHPGAATILPLLNHDRIVLIYNYRTSVNAELLELPAGTIDPGEDPLTCATRELTEETGYHAGTIRPLNVFYTSPGIFDEKMFTFIADQLTPGNTAHEPGEKIRVTTMTFNDALDAIESGQIVDGKTVATLLFYDRFHRNSGTNA